MAVPVLSVGARRGGRHGYLLLQTAVSFSGTRADICGVEVRGDDANLIKDAKIC